jgi:broad specificity phosphatase PhoE
MSELYLIRHGQASLGAENYDQLSTLGYQQAHWLGEYFRDRNVSFDRIVIGAMSRHRQTAESICQGLGEELSFDVHPGFNEFDFKALILAYSQQHTEQTVTDWHNPKQVFTVLRAAMNAWSRDEIFVPHAETWQAFTQRVNAALQYAQQGARKQRVLVASSGGAISMALSQIMGFDSNTLINLNLQSKNTGINHCYFNAEKIYTTSINHVPHLDQPKRLQSITYS